MKNKNLQLFKKICKKHGIKLINVETVKKIGWYEFKNCEFYYRDASYSTNDRIWLGLYENEELKIISFFHELGHCLNTNLYYNKYVQEKHAWKTGFIQAKKYGFKFSNSTIIWCNNQLKTYESFINSKRIKKVNFHK